MKGMLLFTEVENSLKKFKPQFEGVTFNIQGSLKVFSDIEEMLRQERTEFEVCFLFKSCMCVCYNLVLWPSSIILVKHIVTIK